ncbi:endonuclease domain-containing protein [Pseudonocardia sp. TRM90224]|uniref:endonuclease domain-containing protein n=1 Tax=Pseudonocardia sp. TRM90224 TaxID=2812678 RepID=UPI001E3937CC|nr:endonuclease domain-containing protein [Pseudonocardia sp. TRM90224]
MSTVERAATSVPGWPAVFRGSRAVAAGLVTRRALRGPRFVRLCTDTYVPRSTAPPDLALRSRAAFLLTDQRGVLCGLSAAELLGASCAPPGAPAEVVVTSGGPRTSTRGLIVHHSRLAADEMQRCSGVVVTTPLRTAFDLGRWRPDVVERVVAIDALANHGRFDPAKILQFSDRYPGARHRRRIGDAVALADARAGSPMETRLRLVLVLRGLPTPAVQHAVLDDEERRAVWLDLAYPEERIGIEYEGAVHTNPNAVLSDTGRYTRLVAAGWRMYRFTKRDIWSDPDRIATTIRDALRSR